MKKLSILTVIVILLFSCTKDKETIIIVASDTAEATDPASSKYKDCLIVKFENETKWSIFYSSIIGFSYEKGYEYVLEVTVKNIKNPPQDAGNKEYYLKKIISKEKKTSENLPPNKFPLIL